MNSKSVKKPSRFERLEFNALKFALDEIERENAIDKERAVALDDITSVATMDFLEAAVMRPSRIRSWPKIADEVLPGLKTLLSLGWPRFSDDRRVFPRRSRNYPEHGRKIRRPGLQE